MVDIDAEFATWTEWIEGPVYNDIIGMVLGRQIWRQYQDLIKEAPSLVRDAIGVHNQWSSRNYRDATGSAIRRQADLRRDVVGIARLLDRMSRFPRALERHRFLAVGSEIAIFDEVATSDGGMLDPTVPASDLEKLLTVTRPVVRWVNKSVAHYDRARQRFEEGNALTYGDLHEVVDHLVGLLQKYFLLITQKSLVIGDGIITDPWQGAFTVPWWEPELPFEP